MLKRLFNDKKFIFIFTFAIELIFYFSFEHLPLGGEYILPDIGLAPIFGLMFGPIGGLGHATATLIFEIYDGMGILPALMDFMIMLFVSIFTYKLWYSIFKKREINTPKFDSVYNIVKFITIIFIVSILYWILINISLEAYPQSYVIYPLTNEIIMFSYFLNIFNFSIIYGLLLISVFNILKIPMQSPKKWINLTNINYKYFILSFILLMLYIITVKLLNIDNNYTDLIFFVMSIIVSLLGIFNKFEVDIKIHKTNYSIIEEIILIFLTVLSISLVFLFNNFQTIIYPFISTLNPGHIVMITISYGIIIILISCIIHSYYVEKIITQPVYELDDAINKYKKDNRMNNENNYDSKFKKYLKSNDDISVLISSFISLSKKIKIKLENIRKTTAENEKIETELNIASNIQSGMIKKDFNEFCEGNPFEIYGSMIPAEEVCGDFYDYIKLDDENLNFVVGDVDDKGIPATLVMVQTMYSIRNLSKFESSPEKIIEKANNLSFQRNKKGLSISIYYGKLNLKSGKLSFVNAGHNSPLIKHENNDFEYLTHDANFALGMVENTDYKEQSIYLDQGDILFLYTNGIPEATNSFNEAYGENRLKDTLNKYKNEKLEVITDNVKKDIDEFCGRENHFDDMTILMIKYTGCDSDE